jgi:Type I phosphodiesterase / nucleotide pyrophosphatase
VTNNVLMIGLDGATFTLLDPLIEQGVMPFLGGVLKNSVRADLTSTRHPLIPQAWTSMITGRSPTAHGIYDIPAPDLPSRRRRVPQDQRFSRQSLRDHLVDCQPHTTCQLYYIPQPRPSNRGSCKSRTSLACAEGTQEPLLTPQQQPMMGTKTHSRMVRLPKWSFCQVKTLMSLKNSGPLCMTYGTLRDLPKSIR